MPEATGLSRPLSQDLADAAMKMAAIVSTRQAHRAGPLSPAVSDLVYRGLRGWGLAQIRLARLSKKSPPLEIAALLAIAWAALNDELRPAHVIVDEAVSAAKQMTIASKRKAANNKPNKSTNLHNGANPFAGFVNALLRQCMKDPVACARDAQHPQAKWNAPAWWIKRIQDDWPSQASSMLDALHGKGRLTVRVHVRAGLSIASYLDTLKENHLHGIQVGPQAVVIEPAVPVHRIPGFAQGLVSVQDAAAQNICSIFDPLAIEQSWGGSRPVHILDACAAPGGKSIALAQGYPATVWAMDVSADRLQALSRDLPRVASTLRGSIRPVAADVLDPASWPADLPAMFDAIVLDAPCSASGVTRRHPEIPWRRSPQGIADVADIQRQLLDLLWGRLKPGGELAFVTCSVFRDEGEHQQEAFLKRTVDARLMPCAGRVLPGDGLALGLSQDGFFFALFKKQNASRDPLPASDDLQSAAAKPGSRAA